MRVVAVDGSQATIATHGLRQECSLTLVPDARVGDYVLVHAGYALSVIDEAEAQETYELLREVAAFDEIGGEGAGRDGADMRPDAEGSSRDQADAHPDGEDPAAPDNQSRP